MPQERIDKALTLINTGYDTQKRIVNASLSDLNREQVDKSLAFGGVVGGALDRFKSPETIAHRDLVRAVLLTEIAHKGLRLDEVPLVSPGLMRETTASLENRLKLNLSILKGEDTAILEHLKKNPADTSRLHGCRDTERGGTLLHLSADKGNQELTLLLINHHWDVNAQDRNGETPLHRAVSEAKKQHVAVAKELLECGARISTVNTAGQTVVHMICDHKLNCATLNDEKLNAQGRIDREILSLPEHAADYAEATRPKATGNYRATQLAGLVYAGHGSVVVDVLKPDDPVLVGKPIDKLQPNDPLPVRIPPPDNCNLVFLAAKGHHQALLEKFVALGADIKHRDAEGNNALHYACKDGADDPRLAKYLLEQLGPNAAQLNSEGKTALHLAAVNNMPEVARALLVADRGAFDVEDKARLKPLDYAVSKSDTSTCEQVFYAVDPLLDQQRAPPGGNPTVVNTLDWMTRTENPGNFPHGFARKLYEDLYADPLLRPVLEIAARDGIGPRDLSAPGERQALRIVMSDNLGSLGGGGMGNYMVEGNRLNFGGKQLFNEGKNTGRGYWEDGVKGTVIHELTHHAAAAAFKNGGLPVGKGAGGIGNDAQAESKYIKAFEDDVKLNSHLAITREELGVVSSISNRLNGYQKEIQLPKRSFSGKENMQLELIVGVSQAVAQFGSPLVEKLYPNLTDYYKKDFKEAVERSCAQDAVFKDVQIDTISDATHAKAVKPAPAMFFVGKEVVGEYAVTADKVWKMARDEFTFAKGQPVKEFQPYFEKGVPLWTVESLQLVDPHDQTLKTMEKEVKPLLDKLLQSDGLPPQLSTEAVRDLARGISNAYHEIQPEQISAALKTAGGDFVTKANNHYEHGYLASREMNLERKVAKEYVLDTREVAELAIRNHNAVAGRGPGDLKSHEEDVQALIEQFKKLPDEQLAALKTGLAPGSLVHDGPPLPQAGQEAKFKIAFASTQALQAAEGQMGQARLEGGEVPRPLAIEHARQLALAQADYGNLKRTLLADVAMAGEANTKLAFDNGTRQIHIDYDYKDCVDRFGEQSKNQIKQVASPGNGARFFQDIFRDQLASHEVRQGYDELFGRATRECRELGPAAYKEPDVLLHLTPAQAPAGEVNAALAGNVSAALVGKGICLNDGHGDAASKEFVIAQMSRLKAEGVTTLYVEHFWQEQQEMLNAYKEAPPGAPLPPPLQEAVNKLNKGVGADSTHFTQLLEAAKQEGIRVVGLDSFNGKTPQNGDPRNWDHRAARFNTLAAEVVARESDGGKFVLLAGEAHNNTHFSGFPGMAQILGVPAVQVADDGKLALSPEKKEDRGMRTPAEQRFYDTFVDTFVAREPDVFRPVPGDFGESNKATNRGLAVSAAADTLARTYGDSLEHMGPNAVPALAQQIARQTLDVVKLRDLGTDVKVASNAILGAVSRGRDFEKINAALRGANDAPPQPGERSPRPQSYNGSIVGIDKAAGTIIVVKDVRQSRNPLETIHVGETQGFRKDEPVHVSGDALNRVVTSRAPEHAAVRQQQRGPQLH